MSKDIRSFFTVISKKSGDAPKAHKSKKPTVLIESDEDIVETTPKHSKKDSKKTRRTHILSSDSDGEESSKNKESAIKKFKKDEKQKPKLKPIDLDALNRPIKQSEVKHVKEINVVENKKEKPKKKSKMAKSTELGIHGDKDFEKTLIELDEDSDDTILLENLDFLDKTVEEATLAEHLADEKHTKETEIPKKSHENHENKQEAKHVKEKDDKKTPKKRPRKNSETIPLSNKKQKLEHTDSGVDKDLDNWAKKRHSASLYVAYLHRGGPKHHGEKEYPEGKSDCFSGLTFMRTGVLDSLEGEEFENLVTKHGGRLVHSVSKKVSYVVVGDQPGPAKMEKAQKYNLPQISEDEFLDLILVKSGMKARYCAKPESEDLGFGGSEEFSCSPDKKSPEVVSKNFDNSHNLTNLNEHVKHDTKSEEDKAAKKNIKEKLHSSDNVHESYEHALSEIKMDNKIVQSINESKIFKKQPNEKAHKVHESRSGGSQNNVTDEHKTNKEEHKKIHSPEKLASKEKETPIHSSNLDDTLSWTDKYKPINLKGIIGQQDVNSNMNKLKRWLQDWFKNADPTKRKSLPKPTLYNQFDGAYFKAALLSGPPGVGKTTTATLVAKELGFDIVEFNASDTRNKKLLHEELSHMMESKTVAGFVSGQSSLNQKRVLLMDEVDGMAGNEDRGGISELINFIKTAKFPIICMCNNRDLPKMRSLVNHCYALKFAKPNVAQVRGAMLSICFKEGLEINPQDLAQIIVGTGCDIRQTLNHLSMWSATEKSLTSEIVRKESKNSQKDVVIGAWDVIRKVFNKSENKDMTLADKSRLFFYDYSFGPLFVQENYLSTEPECTGPKESWNREKLIRAQLAADCLSRSDLIEARIRGSNNWSLLESQAFFSTVLPSHYLSGTLRQVRFPGWFGKNSQRNKTLRILGEICAHTSSSISANKNSIRLEYAEPLLNLLITPLKKKQAEGIDDTLEVMKAYGLVRDDLTNLCELMKSFENQSNPLDSVSSTVKAALTRKYNKTLGRAVALSRKKVIPTGAETGDLLGEEEEYSEEDDADDINKDTLIKVKNKNTAQAGTSKSFGSQKGGRSKGKADSKGAKGKAKK